MFAVLAFGTQEMSVASFLIAPFVAISIAADLGARIAGLRRFWMLLGFWLPAAAIATIGVWDGLLLSRQIASAGSSDGGLEMLRLLLSVYAVGLVIAFACLEWHFAAGDDRERKSR